MYNAKWPRLFLCALLPAAAFAGQSLVLTPSLQNTFINDPTLAQNQSWRVEFQVHNWTLPAANSTNAKLIGLTGVGTQIYLYGDGRIALEDDRDAIAQQQPCFVNTAGLTNALVRFQRNLSTMQAICEIWNYDGTGYNSMMQTITATNAWNASGGLLGGGSTASLGFLRVFTTTVPPGSKPPTTADGGNWTELKFDHSLNDSSGHAHNASVPGATYQNTPNQISVAFPKTKGAPAWSNWTSLRAGYPSQLDGSSSYSLADASSAVGYVWRQVSGPSTVIWTNAYTASPTLTGLIFGTYTFSLQVTDTAGSVGAATLQTGAVAYDVNGVVIPPDPNVTKLFGPQIAFGQNPWSYEDQQNLYAVTVAQPASWAAAYDYSWTTPGAGTVSYPFVGKGFNPGPTCTALSGSIGATDTTIAVANASCLSLASLPTWILVGNLSFGSGAFEMIRICGASATSGPATLAVCYDGRGVSGNAVAIGGYVSPGAAAAWPSGTKVGEFRVQGTGTHFATDPQRPICPAGVPGPPGPVAYSAGTVTLSAGSTVVTGSGTAWTTGNGVAPTGYIRVAATHGGTAFVFWAQIVTVTDNSHLVLNRPVPANVDGAAFNYTITSPAMYLSLEFNASDGHVGRMLFNGVGCESETAMFAVPTHDVTSLDPVVMSGVHYSYKTALGLYQSGGTFSPNFYGVGIAARSFYYRSGYAPALAFANSIDEFASRDPEIGDGYVGGQPLVLGGIALGSMIDLILNHTTVLTWPNVEQFARNGELGAMACNATDSRDGGYLTAWLTVAADWDTNATNQAAFVAALQAVLTRDQACKRNAADGYAGAEVNSFAHSFTWVPQGPLTLTRGSTAVSGSGFNSGMCAGVDTGTITVTEGSSIGRIASGSLTPGLVRIYITDASASPNYVGAFEYSVTGTTVQLAGIWPGASGTFNFMSENNSKQGWLTGIWTGNTDNLVNNQALEKAWACQYNSPTSLTLNRPWDNASGSTYYLSQYTIGPFGQQPFMLGVKTNQMNWASKSGNATVAAGYQAILPLVGDWFKNYGYDAVNTQGTFYDTVFQICQPANLAAAGSFNTIHGWDSVSGQPACGLSGALGTATERVNSAEGGSAMLQYYLASPTPARKTVVDRFYGAIFGAVSSCTTSVGPSCDGTTASQLDNGSLGLAKWTGFYFGMGGFFANSWPAVRNGTQPASPRTVSVGFEMGSAASVKIAVTAPSSTVSTVSCTAAPCAITVDDRQGSHWYAIQHLSSGGQTLATGTPILLPLPAQP